MPGARERGSGSLRLQIQPLGWPSGAVSSPYKHCSTSILLSRYCLVCSSNVCGLGGAAYRCSPPISASSRTIFTIQNEKDTKSTAFRAGTHLRKFVGPRVTTRPYFAVSQYAVLLARGGAGGGREARSQTGVRQLAATAQGADESQARTNTDDLPGADRATGPAVQGANP